MAKITIADKNTGDEHSATEFNQVKASVNSLYATAEAFSAALTFSTNKFMETAVTQSAAIAYTLAVSGNVDGMVIRHKILSDGVNPITFSADFNVFSKPDNDIYPAGVHILYFNYVGGDVDVVIPTYSADVAPAGDTTAPTYIATYPKTASVSDTSFSVQVQLDEAGTAYVVVVADGAAAPSSAEVKAGTGSGGTGQLSAGNVAVVAASTTYTIPATGLTASTAYDVYVVAEDDEGTPNIQASPVLVNQTTASAPDTTAPLISSATVTDANPSTLVVGFNEVVTITDVTGLTIAGAATPTLSTPTGSGTNTLSFTLSAPLTNGQTVTLEVAGTNNIIDGNSNALVAVSQAITNNVAVPVDITTDAIGIFSLNKLNSAYVGSAIEIVDQDSAAAAQDIGFDGGGLVDVAAIDSYATTNGGVSVVSKFYNQMGGVNFVQATSKTTNPDIAFNNLTKRNSNNKPTMYYSGTKFLDGAFSLGTNFTVVIAYESTSATSVKAIFEEVNTADTANRMSVYSDTSASGAVSVGYQPSGGSLTTINRGAVLPINTMTVQSVICDNGTITARLDGVVQTGTIAKQITANAKLTLGKQTIGSNVAFTGNNANVLIYNVPKTLSEIQSIEAQINTLI